MKKYTSSKSDQQTTETPTWDSYPHGPEYIRASQIARGARNSRPLIHISLATWWRWTKSGLAPQPTRLSRGTTVWRKSEVLAFIEAKHGK